MSFQPSSPTPLQKDDKVHAASVPGDSSLVQGALQHNGEPEIVRPPLPISAEYDMIRRNYFSHVDVDRSQWLSRLLCLHPDIKEFRERVLPVDRAIEFGRLYLPDDRLISQNVLLSLISQHLRTLGLVKSQSSLHEEWDPNPSGDKNHAGFSIPTSFNRSQLTFLVQRGIKHAERFWELTMPGAPDEKDKDKHLLEEISRVIGGAPVLQDDSKPLDSDPPENPDEITLDSEGKLKSATVNQLIWICTTRSRFATPELRTMVCLTYSSFVKAKVLFMKLTQRFMKALEEPNPEERDRSVKMTFDFVREWLRESGKEMEPSVVTAMQQFVEEKITPKYPKLTLQNVLEGQKVEDVVDWTKAEKVDIGKDVLWCEDFTLTSLSPLELARQLTVWASKYFFNIKRSEFLDGSWEAGSRLMHRSPNIVRLNAQRDAMDTWVFYQIISPPGGKQPEQMLKYCFKVAQELDKMKNYMSCMWFLFGLKRVKDKSNMQDLVAKVKNKYWRWEEEAFDKLYKLEENWRGPIELFMTEVQNHPVLPHMDCFLNRIAQFTGAYKTMCGDQVDVTRGLELFRRIQEIERFQQRRYCLLPIDQAQDLIEGIRKIDEAELAQKVAGI